ncbi:MAG: hypothetical protein IKH78_07790 [Ruminococcus sp.]|nr:hypothetical protein [Ruminococcus sp.]
MILLTVRYIGRKISNRTPESGINKEMYTDSYVSHAPFRKACGICT